MSSNTTDASSIDLELARQLEGDILGPWFPLSCGCQLSVNATLPGSFGYMNLRGIGNRLCDQHGDQHPILQRWVDAPKTWMHWYTRDYNGPQAVTQEQFQAAWDAVNVNAWKNVSHVSDNWLLSKEGWKIYRTGAVTETTVKLDE